MEEFNQGGHMNDTVNKLCGIEERHLSPSEWTDLLCGLDDWWFNDGCGGTELIAVLDRLSVWQKFDGYGWLKVLLKHPRFARKCDQHNGWRDFKRFVQFLDDTNGWVQLLSKQPTLSAYCDKADDWQQFSGEEWQILLEEQPRFAAKCSKYGGWKAFEVKHWTSLLRRQPQFGEAFQEYADWERFTGEEWQILLEEQPAFAVKCSKYGGWKAFEIKHWISLLRRQPQFGEIFQEYVGWDKLSTREWVLLLTNAPVFSDICGRLLVWNKFDGFDWVVLLSKRPEFSDICATLEGWKKINVCGRWSELLSLQPQFATKCDEFNGWDAFDGFDWWHLLRHEPLFASRCNSCKGWHKIASYNPTWEDERRSYFDDYGEAYASCYPIPEKLTYFDYESPNFEFPYEYEHEFSRNYKLKILLRYGIETDADGNPTCVSDYRTNKSYYRTLPTTCSYGTKWDGCEIGRLPIDLYDDVFWYHNPSLFKVMDISYWRLILHQHLFDACSMDLAKELFSFYDKHQIWSKFHYEDWQRILSVKSIGARLINRAALSAGNEFWEALLSAWPTVISDANHIAEEDNNHGVVFSGWAYLLRLKPNYIVDCNESKGWNAFREEDWTHLLGENSNFLEKVDKKELNSDFWLSLLISAPKFVDTCDELNGWTMFTKENWLSLMSFNESFVDKCEKSGALAKCGWTAREEAISEAKKERERLAELELMKARGEEEFAHYEAPEYPDWREESGWNDMYGDADPADFIEFR